MAAVADSDRYFIKPEYTPNTANVTLDEVSGDVYWDAERIDASEHFQYYVYRYALEAAQRRQARTVLDVGCGSGRKLVMFHEAMPEARIIGVDQKSSIDLCRTSHDFGEWHVEDIENPGPVLADVRADLVICSDVIEHLLDPDRLLDYIRGKAAAESRIVLSTPERERLRGRHCCRSKNKQHIREWSRDEFATYLENRGFEILDHVLQYPVRCCWSRYFRSEVLKRWLKLKPAKYNQVCLLRLAAGSAGAKETAYA